MSINTAASTQPTMAELVRAISEEAVAPTAPAPVVMHLPKPHAIGRILVVGSVLLIAGMAALLLTLTSHVQRLMVDIRVQEDLRQHPPLLPLPPAERLLDSTTFTIECAARPGEVGRLHAARAQALVAAGRPGEAIEGFAFSTRLTDAPLSPADRVALGEAFAAVGRVDEARATLLATDMTRLDDAERARANACLGRLAMAAMQAEWHRVALIKPGG